MISTNELILVRYFNDIENRWFKIEMDYSEYMKLKYIHRMEEIK